MEDSVVFHVVLVLVVSLAAVTHAAPFSSSDLQQRQTDLSALFHPSKGGMIGPLFRDDEHNLASGDGGCYYQFQHYDEGDRIITNEPCLNCTCHNSMLMCYLKVCPFSKPIGQDCTVEKRPDQCCPVITCPQVPVNLQVMQMTSTTTAAPPAPTTAVVPYTEHGCTIEGKYYPDGAQVPGVPGKPCELCYCIRNHTACVMQECILMVQGCDPIFEDGICCPVRYKCAHDNETGLETTTMVPALAANGSVILPTTTIQPMPVGCMHKGEFYEDGALIPSEDPCEHCYCMKSDLVCAIQECMSPLDEMQESCTPRPAPPGQCCPEAYDCPELPEITTVTLDYSSFASTTESVTSDTDEVTAEVSTDVPVDKTTTDGPAVPDTDETATDIPYVDVDDIVTGVSTIETDETATDAPAEIDAASTDETATVPTTETDETSDVDTDEAATDVPTDETSDAPTVGVDETATEVPTIEVDETTDVPTIEIDETSDVPTIEVDETATDVPSVDTDETATEVPSVDTDETATEVPSVDTDETATEVPSVETDETATDVPSVDTDETATEVPSVETVETTAAPTVEVDETATDVPSVDTDEAATEVPSVDTDETATEVPSVDTDETATEVPSVETVETTAAPTVEVDETATDVPSVDTDEAATEVPTVDGDETTTDVSSAGPDESASKAPAIDTDDTTGAPITEIDEIATVAPEDSGMCYVNGTGYSNNSIVPAYTPCQESCRCINNAVSCQLVACPPAPPAFLRCTSAPVEGECCPSHTCPPVKPPTTEAPGCVSDGVQYYDGEFVPSSDLCSDCYCLGGEVICAILECPQPEGQNCTAVERPPGNCCPTKYECDDVDMPDSLSQVTDTDTEGKVTPSSTFTLGVDESQTETTPEVGEDATSTKAPVDGTVEDPVTPASTDGETPVESTLSTGSPDDMMTGPVIGLETRTTAPDDYSVLTTPMTTITEDISTQTEIPTDIEIPATETSVGMMVETTDALTDTDAGTTDISDIDVDTTTTETTDPELDKPTDTPVVDETTSEVPVVDETITVNETATESPELQGTVTDIPVDKPITDESETDTSTTDAPLISEVTTDADDETTTDIPAIDTVETVTEVQQEVVTTISLPDKGIPGEGSCMANGTTFINGDTVPTSRPCHQSCTCKNSIVSCELQACPPPPPAFLRCAPVEDPEQCCPSYDCPEPEHNTTEYQGCLRDGIQYMEGEYVPSPDICTDCYCLSGEIICAVLECPVPAGANCKPMSRAAGSCCPSKYECDDTETDAPIGVETTTDAPVEIDQTATDAPIEIDQTATDAPVEVDETATDAPVEIDQTSTDAPVEIDQTATDAPVEIDETATDAPVEVDETATDAPVEIDQTATDAPVEIDQTATDAPVVVDETATDAPVEIDQTATDAPVEIDQTATDAPVVVDQTVTDVPVETDQTTDAPVEIDQTATDAPVEIVQTATDAPVEIDQTATDAPVGVDQTVTDGETEVDQTATDAPVEIDQTSTDAPVDIDQTATDAPVEVDVTATDAPVEVDQTSTDTPDEVDETATVAPVDLEQATTDAPVEVEQAATDSPLVDETATDVAAPIEVDQTATVAPVEVEGTTTDVPFAISTTTEGDKEGSVDLPENCVVQGSMYYDGSSVPASSACQENCRCTNGTIMCERPSCPPAPPAFLRCSPIPAEDSCCPTYDCPPIVDPTVCEKDGLVYNDGDYVPSPSECTDCYCLGGEIICAHLECVSPGENCTPVSQSNNSCCPDKYECADVPDSLVSTTISPIGASATDTANVTSTSTVKPVTESISTISTVAPETDFTPSSTIPSTVTEESETASTDVSVTTSPDGIEISFATEGVTTGADTFDSSVITEASVATDGLETESPGITISSFVTEATPESEASDVTDSSVAPDVSSSLDTTSTTESLPSSGEPMITEASVATEEPETEATIGINVDITSSPAVASSSVTSATEKPYVTDSPLTEPTDAGYATEATISVTESSVVTEADVQISTEKPGVTDSTGQVTTESPESTSSESPVSSETASPESPVLTEVPPKTPSEVSTELTDTSVSTESPAASMSTTGPVSTESVVPSTTTETSVATGTSGETPVSTETVSTIASVPSESSTEAPFPPFPGTSSVFPKPETTTWKPTTTTELIVGPGACVFDGEVYLSAQQIPRDDPCDFCFCFRGDIICLQQSCPPPIPGCYEEAIPGFCCPRYECPVTQAVVNITTTTTPIPTYPPVQKVEEVTMCEIGDRYYHPGELVEEASGPCLECRCGKDGMMECEPRECRAEPMLRKILGTKGNQYGR